MDNILKNAEAGKFTEFSDAVKQSLKTKLASREEVKSYISDYDRIQQMKSAFSKINTSFSKEVEPERPSEE